MQLLAKEINENRNAFISLTESVNQAAEANKRYYSEINKIFVEEKYGNQIARMATNAKTGQIDQGLYQQILDIVNSSKAQEEIIRREREAEERRNNQSANLKGDKLTSQEAWKHEFSQAATKALTTSLIGTIVDKATGRKSFESNLNTVLTDKLKGIGISDEELNKKIGRSNLKSNKDLAEAYAQLIGKDVSGLT